MTTLEFSNEFDLLYNNIMSNAAPGLNEYEKSVFLTKALNELILNYFNPKGNKMGEGFDDSVIRQADFSSLITTFSTATYTAGVFNSNGKVFSWPTDVLLPINEKFTCTTGTYVAIPISHKEYDKVMQKSFPEPIKKLVWRLLHSTTVNLVEIIPHSYDVFTDISYTVRYVKKPKPIILVSLLEIGATIDGKTTITECELSSILHPQIVNRAVELAKVAYTGDLPSIVKLNERGE